MKKRVAADLILLLVTFIWGVTFVVVQEAIKELAPLAFNAVRFSIAAVFLFAILFVFYRDQIKHMNQRMIGAGALIGIWLFGGYALQTIGLQYTTSAKAGFITGLSVVLVPLFAYFILRQVPRWVAILGAILATGGLFLLTAGDVSQVNIGDIYVLLCAVSFGLQIVFTGKYAPHYPTLSLALIQVSTVAILSMIFSPLVEPGWAKAFDPATLMHPAVFWALLVTAIPATALAFVAQTEFQKYTTPARVALIFVMEPVFAALTDVWYNGTMLSAKGIVGSIMILIGMLLSELPDSALRRLYPRRKNTAVTKVTH